MPFLAIQPQGCLHYLEENSASPNPILLLHGLGANSTSWQLQIPSLIASGFRVIAPDTPGFGHSTPPGRVRSIADLTAYLPTLLDHLEITATHVIGISMGGTQALQFALDHPARVKSLVLVNTYAKLNLHDPRTWPYYLARFIVLHLLGLPLQARMVSQRIFPAEEQQPLREMFISQVLQAHPKTYRAAMRALSRFNVAHRLSEVRIPTLIITGANDTTIPPAVQRQLAESIATAKQVIIPGAGHAVSVEKADLFNQLVADFLLQVESTQNQVK